MVDDIPDPVNLDGIFQRISQPYRGLLLLPSTPVEDLRKTVVSGYFSKIMFQGLWFCTSPSCVNSGAYLEGEQLLILDDETTSVHYQSKEHCVGCQTQMFFYPVYVLVEYLSEQFCEQLCMQRQTPHPEPRDRGVPTVHVLAAGATQPKIHKR